MNTVRTVLITLITLAILGLIAVYSGTFNIAADASHWGITTRAIETLRDRSIDSHAKDVAVPKMLDEPKLVANGASEYAEMCTGCHLAPGMKDTEMRKGLYPMPPELAAYSTHRTPAEQFWIIKHGLKMSGMPAWGLTHDDERIWSMVAFLRKLPGLTSQQYQELVDSGAGGHSHDHGGDSGENNAEGHEHAAAGKAADSPKTGKQVAAQPHDHGAHSHGNDEAKSALPAEAADAAAVVDNFQKLLAQGKTREASALLDPDVLIFEGGGAERSRAEYASHHLKSDADFMKNAVVAQESRTGKVAGDLAWIATVSRIKTSGAKALDLSSTETMVLRRTPEGWRVTHIHWSSKPVGAGH
jgi:mono/diheme cytochrome c family protein